MSKFTKFILKTIIIMSIWFLVILLTALFYYLHDLPNLKDLETRKNKQVTTINYSNGNNITVSGEIYNNEVNFYEFPEHLIHAVLATEDRKFFNHYGIDFFGIIRAAYVNHKAKKVVQGGSTITQQLAKLLFLESQRTVKRKIQEILLALQLEKNFTKEQILTFYLNRAYFGSGNYGIKSAAKFYFGKEVSELSLNECALLAGILKAPSKLSPKNNQEKAEDRANLVISKMIDAGFLGEKNLSEIDQKIEYKTNRLHRFYFSDFVAGQYADFLSKKTLASEKIISVNTTLDEKIQNELENVANKFIEKNAEKIGKSQIAVIIMKKDGAIIGNIGGKDYQQSQFNRAFFAKRQAGSSFKTIVYLTAFENGFDTDDKFEDKKINIGTWLPDNYEGRYFGLVSLKTSFAKSLNSVSVQILQKIGGKKISSTARQLGITSKIDYNDPTIALGTTELTLLELVSAYATVANDGRAVIPYTINEIKNDQEQIIYQRQSSGLDQVVSTQSIEKIKILLREVVENGTGKNANVAKNIFGKTGTSQNFRDAWFIGFNDDYVIGVWIGNDDNSATKEITGGSLPASFFAEIIKSTK